MRDQELEQRLRTAVEHAAPDPLERILSSCEMQKGTVIPMITTTTANTTNTKRKNRWAPLAMAAVLLIMCTGILGVNQWHTANAVASVVCLDVNPSIQLQVNQKEKVLTAEAVNEDAQVILEDMDLRGTQLNVAVNAIVGSLLQHGYLDSISSAILISVEDDDTERASRLETALTEEVNAALQNASAGAAVLSQVMTQDAGLETQAQANSISVGKAALIQQVQALNSSLEFSALAKLTVEELKEMRETGAAALPIGTSAAVSAAMEYAGLSDADAVTTSVDPELDEVPAHYEVKLKTSFGKYEYRIDAYTGKVLSGSADVTSAASAGKDTSSAALSTSAIITASKAKAVAFKDAGITEANALGLKVELDNDDGVQIYEIEFRANGVEYEYEINAAGGTIRKAERDGHTDSQTASGTSGSVSSSASYIGEAAAQKAALAHAGVSAGSTYYCNAWLEYENGRPDHYEVEFKVGNVRYKYEIGLYNGNVLNYEQEDTGSEKTSDSGKSVAATASLIGEEAAKSAAFSHAGVSASGVSKLKCKLDEDGGSYRYEIEFQAGSVEYEYEIDARTGAVLDYEAESHK